MSEAKDLGDGYLLFTNLRTAVDSAVHYRTRVEEIINGIDGKLIVVTTYDLHECSQIANPRLVKPAAVIG